MYSVRQRRLDFVRFTTHLARAFRTILQMCSIDCRELVAGEVSIQRIPPSVNM